MRTFARFTALTLVLAALAHPAARRKPRPRKPARPISLDVAAAPEIDARVAAEIAKARDILQNPTRDNLYDSPYLISALYYHDGFLDDFPVDRDTAAPERRIIGRISADLTPARKTRIVALLHEAWSRADSPAPPAAAEPVAYSKRGGGHKSAVDLFAPENSPVRAVSRGIVVLADRDWTPDDLFSTASRKGGNAVILFDPDHDRFYRYAHLDAVDTRPGAAVAAGDTLGRVGHTGLNASRPGHGRHLHFEVNEYRAGRVRALDSRQLRALLTRWRRP